MKIAYLKIRNLDSHERKALSFWIGGGVVVVGVGVVLIVRARVRVRIIVVIVVK